MTNVRTASIPALLALAAALGGCGGSGGSSSTSASAPSATATTAPTASTPTSTAAQTTGSTATSTTPTATSPAPTATSTTAKTTPTSTTAAPSKAVPATIALSSPAFKRGAPIPTQYTCNGANESPPLKWQHVPAGTAQLFLFALNLTGGPKGAIVWAVGDIPAGTTSVAAGRAPAGAVVGQNSAGKAGWGGICPGKGKRASIIFLLYALKKKIAVTPGFNPRTVQRQLAGNTAGAGLMYGVYQPH